MCKYESLLDGTLNLYDVSLMNDFLMVCSDNEEIMRKRREQDRG